MGSLGVGAGTTVAYWNVNVPEKLHTDDCPVFLTNLSDKDRRIVGTSDADYHTLSWDEVCDIIRQNRLADFQRVPSELRRYKAWAHGVAKLHGTMPDFVLAERLRWKDATDARGAPFEFIDADVKVLYNDWPYGLDRRIVHLVVWTKFELQADSVTGDLTDRARAEIDAYVSTHFRSRVPPSQVIWFKNWAALKSIHAVEHFHVMMFDPDPDVIRDITNGDVPMCEMLNV